MRRWASALLVVGIVGALVGVGAPASAVEPVAPPVPESPWKQSQLFGMTQAQYDALTPEELRAAMNRNRSLITAQPTRQWTPLNAPMPAGKPSLLMRGAGPLAVVTAVPVIVNGALTIVGASSELGGATADEMICAGVGTTADNVFLTAIYGEVTCAAIITQPNSDKPSEGLQVSYLGTTFEYHPIPYNGYVLYCGGTTPAPTGFAHWVVITPQGTQQVSFANHSTFRDGQCGMAGTVQYNYFEIAPGSTLTRIDMIRLADQVVVATSTALQSDPERTLDCEVEWSDGSTTTSTGLTYKETEGFPLGAAGCTESYAQRPSPGVLPEQWRISSTDDDGARTEVATGEIPSEAGATPAPESNPNANRGLQLLKVVGTQLHSCMTWEAECANWWDESTQGQSTTSPYRCFHAGEPIDLDECGLYRNSFKSTATRVVTDPVSGEDVQWGTGTVANPGTTSPGSGPTPGDECMSSWGAAPNPIEWVFWPVKCAFVWAFVPRMSKVDEFTGSLDAKWKATVAGSVTAGLTALGEAFDAGVGCDGLPFHLEGFGTTLVHADLLSSCEEPAAGIAATVKTILIGVIIAGAFLAVLRYLAATFGFVAFGGGREGVAGNDSGPRFS